MRFPWIRPELAPAPEIARPAPDTVSCSECGVMVLRTKAQSYEEHHEYPFSVNDATRYRCRAHRVDYQRVIHNDFGQSWFFREMRVDEKGVPLGYTPIKSKGVTK